MAERQLIKLYEGTVQDAALSALELIYLPIMQTGLTLKGYSVKIDENVAENCGFKLQKTVLILRERQP